MSREKSLHLSIILPAYNEENGIEHCVKETMKVADAENISYEIIIVENGSTDKTYKIAQQLSEKFSSVSAVHLNESGFENAIREGLILQKVNLLLIWMLIFLLICHILKNYYFMQKIMTLLLVPDILIQAQLKEHLDDYS